jgi:hypothetical protein
MYKFCVFKAYGMVWLFDDNRRDFWADRSPMIWAEPLYPLGDDDDDDSWLCHDDDYFHENDVIGQKFVMEVDDTHNREEAWDLARAEAKGNHYI